MCSGAQETGVSPARPSQAERPSVSQLPSVTRGKYSAHFRVKDHKKCGKIRRTLECVRLSFGIFQKMDWCLLLLRISAPGPATDPAGHVSHRPGRPRVTAGRPARDTRGPTSSPGGGWANTNDCQPEIIPAPIIQGSQQIKNAHLFYSLVFLLSLVLVTRGF